MRKWLPRILGQVIGVGLGVSIYTAFFGGTGCPPCSPTPTPTVTTATATATPVAQAVYPPGWMAPPRGVFDGPLCASYDDGSWTIYLCDDRPPGQGMRESTINGAVRRALDSRGNNDAR